MIVQVVCDLPGSLQKCRRKLPSAFRKTVQVIGERLRQNAFSSDKTCPFSAVFNGVFVLVILTVCCDGDPHCVL